MLKMELILLSGARISSSNAQTTNERFCQFLGLRMRYDILISCVLKGGTEMLNDRS